MSDQEEFVKRCIALENGIKALGVIENSPRVWISVLANLMKFFINMSGDKAKALKQVTKDLKS